ncbi:MAG: CRISPR-associated endonuclease Cas1 [Gammaproteobacteria bacterium]|nr:CRISPR-associated endonuclease Cas1 [Gammaproteobacteria bacterium]
MLLVIDRQKTIVRLKAGCLVIEQPERGNQRIPVSQLEQVVVYGNPLVESSVWRVLSENSVPAVLLAVRGNRAPAMLGSGLAVQLPSRKMQHRIIQQPDQSLYVAKWFVTRKLKGYDLPISLISSQMVSDEKTHFFLEQRDTAVDSLARAERISEVIGIEGSVARSWFALLTKSLPRQWNFFDRNRRPPKDPVNALLSLGYTMAHSVLRQEIIVSGFDPSLGFVHQEYPGREALALDFLEIFRCSIDYFVLEFILKGTLSTTDFHESDDDGCFLNKAARPIFYKSWAEFREYCPNVGITKEASHSSDGAPLQKQIVRHLNYFKAYLNSLEEADA